AALAPVIKVVTEVIGIAGVKDSRVAGADVITRGLEDRRATAAHHIVPLLVEVRPGDGAAAAHPDFVGAVGAPTTLAPIDEQVILIGVAEEAGRFDRIVPGQRMDG